MENIRSNIFFSQYCISLGLISTLLYMYGFFPIKTPSRIYSSRSDFPTQLGDIRFNREKLYNDLMGKTVLMIIDGIRVDFVTENNMPYTMRVLGGREGGGCRLTARASAPTVTLPRLKAMVTGSVSSFIDVIFNFGTQELTIDNIVHQAAQTKKIVFYGDDTWIKLFPRHFTRSEGTSSFFVTDFTEVDDNVTRHLSEELEQEREQGEWQLMILHYLGLDHIGHIHGPGSPLIADKLREMDAIIRHLHSHLREQGGVLLVCGDHGMKDSGSHGGVSTPEVLVPILFLGLQCPHQYKEIRQEDLAPTLSVLWGAPIPADSVGALTPELLSHLSPPQQLYALLYNGQQLSTNFLRNGGSKQHESYLMYKAAVHAHHQWLTNSSGPSSGHAVALYLASLHDMSRLLTQALTRYHLPAMAAATLLLAQVVMVAGVVVVGGRAPVCPPGTPQLAMLTAVGSVLSTLAGYHSLALAWLCLFIVSYNTAVIYHLVRSASKLLVLRPPLRLSWQLVLPVGSLLFYTSLFSSSLIEEEHQLWYFLWATVAASRLPGDPVRWLLLLATHRVLRALNQTGDKWAHLPDLSDWLTAPQHLTTLSALCAISLLGVWACCARLSQHRASRTLQLCVCLCIFLHKSVIHQVSSVSSLLSSSGVLEAQMSLLLTGLLLAAGRSLGSTVSCCMLLLSLLLRSHNTLLVPALFLVSTALLPAPTLVSTALHHWIGAVFFFYQGNSNGLASVDIAAGYVGQRDYNAVVVAALLLAHTYGLPALAYLLNLRSLVLHHQWRGEVSVSGLLVVFLQLTHVWLCLLIITLHRYHLFVWTVFSPKLLYVAAQTFVFFLLITVTNICIYCNSPT